MEVGEGPVGSGKGVISKARARVIQDVGLSALSAMGRIIAGRERSEVVIVGGQRKQITREVGMGGKGFDSGRVGEKRRLRGTERGRDKRGREDGEGQKAAEGRNVPSQVVRLETTKSDKGESSTGRRMGAEILRG